MEAIIELPHPNNRHFNRPANREKEYAEPILEHINSGFIAELFNPESVLSYKQLYDFFAAKWKSAANYLNSKHTHIVVQADYFKTQYAPQL